MDFQTGGLNTDLRIVKKMLLGCVFNSALDDLIFLSVGLYHPGCDENKRGSTVL
jgi:hypothetical protein